MESDAWGFEQNVFGRPRRVVSASRRRPPGARLSSGAARARPIPAGLPLDAMQEIALFESGGIALHSEVVDCRSVIHAMLAAHSPGVEQSALFRGPLEAADLMVRTDKRVLELLLEYLTRHALEGHASVRIAGVRRGDETVDICVSDRGPGLTLHSCVRADGKSLATTSAREALGVRLKISRRLAKLVNGRITRRTDPEQGRTFTLTLKAPRKGTL